MRTFVFLLLLLPFTVIGQSKNDYQKAMARFQRFYNAGQADSIYVMFKPAYRAATSRDAFWTSEQNSMALKEFGTLESFDFLGVDSIDHVYVFKTLFSKADAKTTGLTLDDDLSLITFRFITTSEEIDNMLKMQKTTQQR